MTPKVVVVTPVRNEAWILDRFLAVASRCADLVIVADQNSTDDSRDICRRHPKCLLIENPSAEFNEAERQLMLIARARAEVAGPRVVLALDADEVLAADALAQDGWRSALSAAPGTVLCFEKPDLLNPPDRAIRYDKPWPIGYVDDGAEHRPQAIHSIRVPTRPDSPRLVIDDVKVLHYALTRPEAQAAKMRMYAALENLKGYSSVVRRRLFYAAGKDYTLGHRVEPCDPAWFAGWEAAGIDMRSVPRQAYNWQDFEVLRLFARHGTRRFWLDDIWGFDWERCRRHGLELGLQGLPERPVAPPPFGTALAGWGVDLAFGSARRVAGWLRRRTRGPA